MLCCEFTKPKAQDWTRTIDTNTNEANRIMEAWKLLRSLRESQLSRQSPSFFNLFCIERTLSAVAVDVTVTMCLVLLLFTHFVLLLAVRKQRMRSWIPGIQRFCWVPRKLLEWCRWRTLLEVRVMQGLISTEPFERIEKKHLLEEIKCFWTCS